MSGPTEFILMQIVQSVRFDNLVYVLHIIDIDWITFNRKGSHLNTLWWRMNFFVRLNNFSSLCNTRFLIFGFASAVLFWPALGLYGEYRNQITSIYWLFNIQLTYNVRADHTLSLPRPTCFGSLLQNYLPVFKSLLLRKVKIFERSVVWPPCEPLSTHYRPNPAGLICPCKLQRWPWPPFSGTAQRLYLFHVLLNINPLPQVN